MKIELAVTLKSRTNIWKKGQILDDRLAPFPSSISREIKLKHETIKILSREIEKIEDSKPVENCKQEIVKKIDTNGFDFIKKTVFKKRITKTAILKMRKQELIDYSGKGDNEMKRRELIALALEKLNDRS